MIEDFQLLLTPFEVLGGMKGSNARNNDKQERVKDREGSDRMVEPVSSGSRKKPPGLRDCGGSKSRPAQVGWIS